MDEYDPRAQFAREKQAYGRRAESMFMRLFRPQGGLKDSGHARIALPPRPQRHGSHPQSDPQNRGECHATT
jgi:hypothetical protein